MNKTEQLLTDAKNEIANLRRANELMAAKIEGFETAAMLVNAQPQRMGGMCMGEDLVYKIEKHLEEQCCDTVKRTVVHSGCGPSKDY